jgi:hypothetical protein
VKLICSRNKHYDGHLELNYLLPLRKKINFILLKIMLSCYFYIQYIWSKVPELWFQFFMTCYEQLTTENNLVFLLRQGLIAVLYNDTEWPTN